MRFERYIKGKKDYYLRSILFSYEGLPILFVSQDKEGELYLCECTESRFGKFEWTFSKTDCNILEQLLSKKITIYEAMKAKSSLKQLITYDIAEDLTYQEEKPFFDIEPERLPEKDAYLEISDNGAEQDIRTLKAERDHRVT